MSPAYGAYQVAAQDQNQMRRNGVLAAATSTQIAVALETLRRRAPG